MRNTFKVLFYAAKGKEKNGIVPIMGRVTVNGQVAQFSCKLTVTPSLWDVKGNRAKGKGDEAQKINHALDKIKARIIELYNQIRERENFVTAEMVRNAYQGVGNEYECLLTAFDKYTADFGKRVGKDRAFGTYNKLCVVRRHLETFIKTHYKRKDMAMKELTEDFIRQFDIYLRSQVGLASSTIWMYTIPLKAVVTRAHTNGQLHRNPFAQYHISPNVKERQFLTEGELQRVMSIPLESRPMERVRDIFVFCCFTGTAYADVVSITAEENLFTDEAGDLWLKYSRKKNDHRARVKLLPEAINLLDKYRDKKRATLFPAQEYRTLRANMKSLRVMAGLSQDLVYHMRRHRISRILLKTK